MVPEELLGKLGIHTQTPAVVARAVVLLMADESRRGHLVHVDHGVYKEIDEAVMLPAYRGLMHKDTASEGASLRVMEEAIKAINKAQTESE
jgi:hypothetical protein